MDQIMYGRKNKKAKITPATTLSHGTILLHDLTTIPLDSFISVYLNKEYALLIKSGNPDELELITHWNDLLLKYFDLLDSEQSSAYLGMQKQIWHLSFKMQAVSIMFSVWLISRNEDIKTMMSKRGFFFDKNSPENIIVNQFDGTIKNWNNQIKIVQKQMDEMEAESTSIKVTRETFISNIVDMKKEGYNVSLQDSTEMYAVTLRKYKQYITHKYKSAS